MDQITVALSNVEEPALERALAALERRREPHYRAGDARPKLQDLFHQVLDSIDRRDHTVMAAYGARLGLERARAGFDLAEVQTAFNVLEEALWAEAVTALRGDDRIRAVQAISLALGAGRDALARAYLESDGAAEGPAAASESDPRRSSRRGGSGPGGARPEALVRTQVQGQVGVMTLDHEPKRNALGARMAHDLIAAIDWFAARDVRAIVLRARPGLPVWSAGHDVDELPRGRRDPLAYNDPLEQLVRAVRTAPQPVIAMIHGSVWGGAFDLVLSCDVVVADETATFAITPANLGLPYNTTGLLHFLGRVPVNVVKEMFFAAEPIAADQAERWLIVNHLVPAGELEDFTLQLAATMASKAPLAIAAVKEQLRVLTDYQPVAAQVHERIQGLRREAYDSSDYMEGLAAFADKRPPNFRGV